MLACVLPNKPGRCYVIYVVGMVVVVVVLLLPPVTAQQRHAVYLPTLGWSSCISARNNCGRQSVWWVGIQGLLLIHYTMSAPPCVGWSHGGVW